MPRFRWDGTRRPRRLRAYLRISRRMTRHSRPGTSSLWMVERLREDWQADNLSSRAQSRDLVSARKRKVPRFAHKMLARVDRYKWRHRVEACDSGIGWR